MVLSIAIQQEPSSLYIGNTKFCIVYPLEPLRMLYYGNTHHENETYGDVLSALSIEGKLMLKSHSC